MQCSHSMHLALSAGDLDDLNNQSAPSVSLSNGTTVIARTVSTNAIDILEVPLRPYPVNVKKSKRDASSRFSKESFVHSIPLIVLFCFFCLWIASSGPDPVQNTS